MLFYYFRYEVNLDIGTHMYVDKHEFAIMFYS